MKTFTTKSWKYFALVIATLACQIVSAQNVYYYSATRHDFFTQSTTNRASMLNATRHYIDPDVQSYTGADYVDSATVKVPTGQTYTLVNDGSGAFVPQQSIAYNTYAPAGLYLFHTAENGSSVFETLHLVLSAPAAAILPLRIANWTEAQTIDASQDFTLTWDKPIKSGTHDYLVLQIFDSRGTNVLDQRVGLDQTNFVIGAYTLQPNMVYNAYLSVFHYFSLNNRIQPYSFTGERHFTQFHIKTINPAGLMSFASRATTALESDGTAYLRVRRTEGTQGQVTVDYFTEDGTAHSNVDYTAVSGTLVFPDGVSSQTIEVPLLNTPTHDSPVTVHLTLTNATGGATLVTHPHSALTIRDTAGDTTPTLTALLLMQMEAYSQNSTAFPTQTSLDVTSQFTAEVIPGFAGSISFGLLEGPGGTISLSRTFDNYRALFENDQLFPSSASMMSTVRPGKYSFYVEDISGNVFTTNLIVGAERKISPPVVSNWTAAQAIDPAQDFVVNWNPFVGGTTNDFIRIIVQDSSGEYVVYTPNEFESGALRPPKLGYIIPANTLQYGKTYNAQIVFTKIQNRQSANAAIHASTTSTAVTLFPLKTIVPLPIPSESNFH